MKRLKTLMKIAAVGMICIGLALAAAAVYVTLTGGRRLLSEEALEEQVQNGWEPDCILILGAGVWNGTPSPMLHDRLEEGLALYRAGLSPKILVSGDHGRDGYDEVNVMKNYLVDAGVSAEDVFMDHAGFSTYESMYRAKKVFGVHAMIVVTQAYHQNRALYIANALGMDAYGVGADPRRYAGHTMRLSREWVARAKDFLYVLTDSQPTYLGEPIDIHGDGSQTDDH